MLDSYEECSAILVENEETFVCRRYRHTNYPHVAIWWTNKNVRCHHHSWITDDLDIESETNA